MRDKGGGIRDKGGGIRDNVAPNARIPLISGPSSLIPYLSSFVCPLVESRKVMACRLGRELLG
jgi:hypothetical protein